MQFEPKVLLTLANATVNSFAKGDDELEWRALQPLWDLRIGYEKYWANPLFPIVLSIVFYFFSVLPWTIIDLYGKEWKWVQRYKIQPDQEVTWPLIRKAIGLTAWNQMIFILPLSISQWLWTPDTFLPEAAPTLWDFMWKQYVALMIFDFQYFVWHSTHHKVRFLYRHVHSVHHQYHAPSAWVTQYLHPWELISVGIFSTTAPWIVKAHPLTCLSFEFFAIVVSVDAHIGYDLPFLPHNWAPFWGGSIKHDMHHQKPLTNFEPFFTWWDKFFGSECPGQLAGGYKPEKLVAWEDKHREEKRKRLAAKGYILTGSDTISEKEKEQIGFSIQERPAEKVE